MSKIHKALGRLRNEAQEIERDRGAGSDGAKLQEGDNKSSHHLLRHRRYSPPEGLRPEKAPKKSIEVDYVALREGGLWPQDRYMEELAQRFRRIKRPILNIAFGALGAEMGNSNVVMVASAMPKSGKSFCSMNLALSIARERDIGAVLVDADVLKPNISRAFGIETRVGLIDYLLDPQMSLDDILVGTDLHDIVVVPAGGQHEEATELLASRRMEEFTDEMSLRFRSRAIIVDTPPLMLTNEAHVLAEHMGQIVLVIESGVSSKESVSIVLNALNRDKPINAIVNKARGAAAESYGAGYGGGYYGYNSANEVRRDSE